MQAPDLEPPIPPPHIASSPSSPSSPSSSSSPRRRPSPGVAPTPKSPHAQVACLAHLNADADAALVANQAYQRALEDAMTRVDQVRRRAAALKDIVASLGLSLAASDAASTSTVGAQAQVLPDKDVRLRAPGMLEPAVPYFRAMYGQDLPLNEDAQARERYLAAIHTRSWRTSERLKLKGEVVAHNHRLVAREAMLRGDDPAEAVARQRRDDPAWFMRNVDGLDWDSIALVMPHRTALSCKIHWLAHDHPDLAARGGGGGHGVAEAQRWTPSEDRRLESAVERLGAEREGNWEEVARAVGPNRTPTMCARRWRRRPKSQGTGKVDRFVWTDEDDLRLKQAVQEWGENWDVVARHIALPAALCRLRFQNSLVPTLRRGRFSPAEDALVVAGVDAFGTDSDAWAAVARRLEGRTEVQCRERWVKSLDPRIRGGSRDWTGEEDDLLVELYEVDNLGWAEISQRAFGGERSAAHVSRRYDALRAVLDPAGADAARALRNKKDQERRARRRDEREAERALTRPKKRGRPKKVRAKVKGEGEGEEGGAGAGEEGRAGTSKRIKVE
ncbi:hypothetical protein JCM9279_002260 [Rhodotorula babjevae]